MRTKVRFRLAAVVAAVSLAAGGLSMAAPATASTNAPSAQQAGVLTPYAGYSASGTRTCPTGEKLYVRVTLSTTGTVEFFTSRGRIHQSYANFH